MDTNFLKPHYAVLLIYFVEYFISSDSQVVFLFRFVRVDSQFTLDVFLSF